jgi:adenylylsulfate kinase
MVVWIIGLSGSGKTTLAEEVYRQSKKKNKALFFLDGDVIREVFNHDLGHELEDRRINASRMSQLSKYLDDQGISVVCSILSIFQSTRDWNRENINNYYEVFIDSDIEDLRKRDVKGIYKAFSEGKINNVVGEDIKFMKPKYPDLVIENNQSLEHLISFSDQIAEKLT